MPVILSTAYGQEVNLEDLFYKALDAVESKDYSTALELFDKVLEYQPENIASLINKGSVLLELERYDEALDVYEKVLEIAPENLDAQSNKGVVLINLERYEEAITIFDEILQKYPNDLIALTNKISAIDQMGRLPIENSKYIAYLQIEVRNSSGFLVGFFEGDSVKYLPHSYTDEYLDSIPIQEIKEIDGKQYELRKIVIEEIKQEHDFSGFTIIQTPYTNPHLLVFTALHHGIMLEKGDHFIANWTIMRLVE